MAVKPLQQIAPDLIPLPPDADQLAMQPASQPVAAPQAPVMMPAYQPDPQRQARERQLQANLDALQAKSMAPAKGFWGKAARALTNVANVAGNNILGAQQMSMIPGTQANQIGQYEGNQAALNDLQQQDEKERALQIQEKTAEAKNALVTISPEEAEAIGDPALVGQRMTQPVFQRLFSTAQTNKNKSDIAAQTNKTRSDIAGMNAQLKKDLVSLKPEQRDDRAIRLMQKDPSELTPEEASYLKAYDKWVQETKVQPGIARAAAYMQFRPVATVDDMGNVSWDSAQNAIANHMRTPQTMNFRTAAALARYMTSGKGGSTLTAYRTAYDHLDLLKDAANALQNGDVQQINALSNRFKQEMGHSAPTNFNAVKTMLAGEIANVAKASGATDQEIKEARDELNAAQSPEQIQGIIQTNQDLMDQKAIEMSRQYESGMQGQPIFGHSGGENPAPKNAPNTGKPDYVYVPGKGLVKQ